MMLMNMNDPFGIGIPVAKREPKTDSAMGNCLNCGDERIVSFEVKPYDVPVVKCDCGSEYELTGL